MGGFQIPEEPDANAVPDRDLAPFADFGEAARAGLGHLAGTNQAPVQELILRLLTTLVSAEARCEDALRRAAKAESDSQVDPLTGLVNRRGWVRALEVEDARSRRFGLPASIAVIDLDELKMVNDTHGHAAGDDVLKRAARTIVGETRAHDVVARLGGDEFGLLAVDCDREQADALGLRLSARLRAEGIEASIGLATREESTDLRETWEKADVAMYRAKQVNKVDLTISERSPDPESAGS
ncbi:MAG TPA: GGDEF domain-containing protein [Actinomycetota bacterium]|nr:GGDEF domain-containing protein [Actinomycetota bacterium]